MFLDQVVHGLGPEFLRAEFLERVLLEVGERMFLEKFGHRLIEGLAQIALKEFLYC
jgi:hypothetical protein